MIPLPDNPTVIVGLDQFGNLKSIASNISANLAVVFTRNEDTFKDKAANQPFDSTRFTQKHDKPNDKN